MRNYDYVMVLVPWLLGVQRAGAARARWHWVLLAVAYLVAWIALLIPGRPGGSELLWISPAVLLGLLWWPAPAGATQRAAASDT